MGASATVAPGTFAFPTRLMLVKEPSEAGPLRATTVGVCVASPDGARRRVLTSRCSTDLFDGVAWSPDGRQIACQSRSGMPDRQTGLIAINVRTKRLRLIVRGALHIGAMDWQPLPRR